MTCLNDNQPVAQTLIITECFKRLVLSYIKAAIPVDLDQHQLAYQTDKLTDDTITTALHAAVTHLDHNNMCENAVC